MKPFVLAAVMAVAGGAHAQGVRLLPAEENLHQRLLEERPTFAKSVTMMVVGSSLVTLGGGAAALGAGLIASAGGAVLSGIGIAFGAFFLAAGGGVVILGVAMALTGGRLLRAHYRVGEQLELVRRGQASPEVAMATIANF